MTNPLDDNRSGWNKAWVDSLPELTPTMCRDHLAGLAEMPIKKCETTVGCDDDAVWLVDFHGCMSLCACAPHADLWTYEMNRVISEQGEIPCTDCGLSYTNVPTAMKRRAI